VFFVREGKIWVKQEEFKDFEKEGRERKEKQIHRDSKNVIIIILIVVKYNNSKVTIIIYAEI